MGKEYFCELTKVAAIISKPVSWIEYKVENQHLSCKVYRGERYIPVSEAKQLLKRLLKQEDPEALKNPRWCIGLDKSSTDTILLENLDSKSIDLANTKTIKKATPKNKKAGVKKTKPPVKIKPKSVQKTIKIPKILRETPEEAKQRQARNAKTFEHFRSTWCDHTDTAPNKPIRKMDKKRYYDQEE